MTRDTAFETIERAKSPGDLFSDPDRAKKRYHAWAIMVHPDRNPDQQKRAERAFHKLNELWIKFERGDRGLYTFSTRKATYEATGPALVDAACNVYQAVDVEDTYIRVPRSARSDDLMLREAAALRRFHEVGKDWTFPSAFTSELVEASRAKDGRRFHVVRHAADLHALHDLHRLLPAGVKLRDLAWMMRRVLTGLAAAHKAGIVYGAPVPSNLAIQAELHGVVLTNWTSSADPSAGERVLAVDPRYKKLIAPEVLKKETPTPASDLYTFARTFKLLAGDYSTPWFSAFVRGCSLEDPRRRPQSAFELREEFDDLLERAFGPRRFRPFAWPEEHEPNMASATR